MGMSGRETLGCDMLMLASLFGILMVGAAVDFTGVLKSGEGDDDAPPAPGGGDLPENTIEGTPLADIIVGGAEAEAISGDGGDDQIGGYQGADTLDGGTGADDLHGMDGDDTIVGGAGNDTLHGEDGGDRLEGGAGDDLLAGYEGDDTLSGGAGKDALIGGGGADRLDGGAGDDALEGMLGDDTLTGGAGQDTLMGGDGNDVLDGRVPGDGSPDTDGRDFLNGGRGDDTILVGRDDWADGGEGADGFVLSDWLAEAEGSATIGDYDPAEDQLVIVYDPTGHPDPVVAVEPDEGTEGAIHILLDGAIIARVLDNPDLTAADITLIAQDEVQAA